MATVAFKRAGDVVILIGETKGHLGQSIYLREIEGREEGAAPPVDLAVEKKNGDFVRGLIEAGRVDTVHDCSDGGLLVAIAEMAHAARHRRQHRPGRHARRHSLLVRRRPGALCHRRALCRGREDRGRSRAPPYIPVAELGKTGGDAIILDDKASMRGRRPEAPALKAGFPELHGGRRHPVTN